jgi:putative ABC transport system permease protein
MIKTLIKYKLRNFFKPKQKNLINQVGLTIALTVFIVIFYVASFELSFDRFHKDYTHIYRVQNTRIYKNMVDESAGCPPATGPTLQREINDITNFTRVKPLSNSVITILEGNEPTNYSHNNLFYADNSFFDLFSSDFTAGNKEEALSQIRTAVVTKSFGMKYFGTENVLGRHFSCNSSFGFDEFTITGVIEDWPENSYLDFDCLLSYPTLEKHNSDATNGWGWNSFNTFVKLNPAADLQSVTRQLKRVVDKYNLSNDEMTREFTLQPIESIHLKSNLRHEIGRRSNLSSIFTLGTIAVFILLIAWINYLNIAASQTKKELLSIHIKKVLGGTKALQIFDAVLDAVLLNTLAIAGAFFLLKIFTPVLGQFYAVKLHALSIEKWFVIIAVSYTIAMFSGIISASTLSPSNKLVKSGKGSTYSKSFSLRNAFVVFQFVVSIVFIITTILIIKQINFLQAKQNELALENIITIKSLTNEDAFLQSQKAFAEEMVQLPGIVNVSVSSSVPGGNYSNVIGGIRPVGAAPEKGIKCSFIDVNENYFSIYQIPLLAGRNFYEKGINPPQSVIINRKAAEMLGFDNPSGSIHQELILGEADNDKRMIVGVVEDFNHHSLEEPVQPTMYHYVEYGDYISVKYSSSLEDKIISLCADTWEKNCPSQPFDFSFNDQYYASQYSKFHIFSRLVSTFSLLIILISSIGLYALAKFTIGNRIKEIGIRKVNGARITEILSMLNKNFVMKVVFAFIIATPVAWYAMNKWLENFAYKTTLSWWIFALAGLLALGIALLTVSWQSWKAATRNPVEALRYE